MFQSHAGSIEAPPAIEVMENPDPGFNPTLVRLRLESGSYRIRARTMFQSHAGSIEAQRFLFPGRGKCRFNPTLVRLRRGRDSDRRSGQMVFQSHAGSIEALDPVIPLALPLLVSIPRWFD